MHRVLFGLFALAACLQGGLAKIETDQDVLVLTEANFDEAIKVRAVCCGCRVRAAACGEGGVRSGHCLLIGSPRLNRPSPSIGTVRGAGCTSTRRLGPQRPLPPALGPHAALARPCTLLCLW